MTSTYAVMSKLTSKLKEAFHPYCWLSERLTSASRQAAAQQRLRVGRLSLRPSSRPFTIVHVEAKQVKKLQLGVERLMGFFVAFVAFASSP